MAKLYYPPECPFCEAPQTSGEGDVDGRWNGPNKKVIYECGATAHFEYCDETKKSIVIFSSGCNKNNK